MIYQILAISLIIVEGILILISFRSLKDIQAVSKDFAAIFGKVKEEISLLFKELIALSIKRENHMLHTTFHLDEVEMYVKMILEKLEQEKDTKSTNN